MHYKNLLFVMAFIAIGALALAAPTDRVKARSRELAEDPSSFSMRGPYNTLAEAMSKDGIYRSYDGYLTNNTDAGTWRGLDRKDFSLDVRVTLGASAEDVEFAISYSGLPGYDLADGNVEVTFDDIDLLDFHAPATVDETTGHLRFKAADLRSSSRYLPWGGSYMLFDSPIKPLSALQAARFCRITVYVTDPRPAHIHSRAASALAVESEPVVLHR